MVIGRGDRGSAMRVISASRRTDIPAFYSRWLLERLRDGFCHWINPFGGQVYRTSLAADDVIALVFWTRDPRPLLGRLEELDALGFGGRYYFHLTLTAYPRSLEPFVADADALLPAVRGLSSALGPARLIWRYDPILLTDGGPFTPEWHVRQFERLAAALDGLVDSCNFSFATYYAKTSRRLDRVARSLGVSFLAEPGLELRLQLVDALASIARGHGIRMCSCCGPDLVPAGVGRGHCVDAVLLQALRPDLDLRLAAAPTRTDCGCVESTDIGAFDTCLFGCEYCYATVSQAAAQTRHRVHDPSDTVLWRPSTLCGRDLAAVEMELRPGRSVVTPATGQQEWLPQRGREV